MDFATYLILMQPLRLQLIHEAPPKNVPVLVVPVESVIDSETITYEGAPVDVGPQIRMICTLPNGQVMRTGWFEVQKHNFQNCEPDTE